MKRIAAGSILLALIAVIFLMNASFLAPRPKGPPILVAHRGFAQRFSTENLTSTTCTAAHMLPTEHRYLENTLPSMRAAFATGADMIEIDVHPTTDGQFAVFHDWTLDCRTNGKGVTRTHSMAELKTLDIGYGYTADGGRTFPFRGQGIGMMPTLDEVLAAFPDRRILINVKSNDPNEGTALAARLARLPPAARSLLIVYGGDKPANEVRRLLPDMRIMTRSSIVGCLGRYLAYGWTGLVPRPCRNTAILLPINVAPWVWGWPNRFLDRMNSVGAEVFVAGPYHGGEFTTGLDTAGDLKRLPAGYAGGVWTDEIALAARAFGRRPAPATQ